MARLFLSTSSPYRIKQHISVHNQNSFVSQLLQLVAVNFYTLHNLVAQIGNVYNELLNLLLQSTVGGKPKPFTASMTEYLVAVM